MEVFLKSINYYHQNEKSMARLFSNEYDSDKVRNIPNKIEYKKLIFVAYEGVVTEPSYFKNMSQFVKSSKKYAVKIFPVNRFKKDGKSHPIHVRDGLFEYYNENLKGVFDKNKDELWIVIDIDKHFSATRTKTTEEVYDEFLESLDSIGNVKINAAISNPSFELWLLLHFECVEELDLEKIKENKRINKKKTYIKKYLDDCIKKRKEAGDTVLYTELTDKALQNVLSNRITDSNNKLILEIGTSMNKLIMHILEKEITA